MRKVKYVILSILAIPTLVLSQVKNSDLNVLFKQDFEHNTIGIYLEEEWQKDWLSPAWSNRQVPPVIYQSTNDAANPTKSMQWNFPEGSLGPEEGGGQWESFLGSTYYEVYFSYDVLFEPGFEYALGGKLNGLRGGPDGGPAGTKPAWGDGFTASIAFHPEGRIVFYTYNQDQPGEYGEVIGWNAYVVPGKWHNITYRVVMNTIGELEGNNDGILEGFFDGKLVCQRSNMHFRNISSMGVDGLKIYSFFGGADDRFRNTKDEWIRFDNFMLYTFKDYVNVPRGNTPSGSDRIINDAQDFSDKPRETPNNQVSDSTSLKVYPNPASKEIFVNYEIMPSSELMEKSTEIEKAEIQILNMSGITVFSKIVNLTLPLFSERIDLPEVPSGLYLVVLKYANRIETDKLLVSQVIN